jgi:hypothetical protein
MNGIYLEFPIDVLRIEQTMNKTMVKFHPYSSILSTIQHFAKLEYSVIESYKIINGCNKKISNLLSKQMYCGNMKLSKEYYSPKTAIQCLDSDYANNGMKYIIKISGIWETEDEIGITYKLLNETVW